MESSFYHQSELTNVDLQAFFKRTSDPFLIILFRNFLSNFSFYVESYSREQLYPTGEIEREKSDECTLKS